MTFFFAVPLPERKYLHFWEFVVKFYIWSMSGGIFKAWSCLVRENTTVYSIIGQKVTRMYKWATLLFCVMLLLCHFANVAKRYLSSYILRTVEMQAGSRCTTTYPSQVHWLVKTQVTSSNYTDITWPTKQNCIISHCKHKPVSLFQTSNFKQHL